ncbi:MAG: hypothetical protein GVY07_15625 [Bacteroidetes bacterium]|jgi:antibiotic biosynthesis monooxygenase (ABM) superfamily enzyme|nr:hypothetical protein [Bacteroidota bacterium]
MIFVHIEHFLNEQGQHYFDKWVADVADTLKEFEGFISISVIEKLDSKHESHLMLIFENEELLKKWSNSKEHDHLIDKLKPYQTRKQSSEIYREVRRFINE